MVIDDQEKGYWEKHKMKYGFIVIFVVVLLVWVAAWCFLQGGSWGGIPYAMTEKYLQIGDRGTFGDMFGAVNALFSGMAFAGLICTLIVQMRELKAQREELSLTRDVMKDQKKVMEKQAAQIDVQNFENGFFQLLKLHFETISFMSTSVGKRKLVGSSAFRSLLVELFHSVSVLDFKEMEAGDIAESMKKQIKDFEDFNYEVFTEYLLSLIGLLSFIEQGGIRGRFKYRRIIAGRIGEAEMTGLIIMSFKLESSVLDKLIVSMDGPDLFSEGCGGRLRGVIQSRFEKSNQ